MPKFQEDCPAQDNKEKLYVKHLCWRYSQINQLKLDLYEGTSMQEDVVFLLATIAKSLHVLIDRNNGKV